MTTIFDDGTLEAIRYENGWVFVRWVQNTYGRLQKRLIKDLNFIERIILEDHLYGWFTTSEINHKEFHKLLQKFGAKPDRVENGFQYFLKRIANEGDLHVRAKTTKRASTATIS